MTAFGATIAGIETGGTHPHWKTIKSLCDAFNSKLPKHKRVSVSFLAGVRE